MGEQVLGLDRVFASRADLYLFALTILADCEHLEKKKDTRSKQFLAGYTKLPGANGFSAKNAAKAVVDLYDNFSGENFAGAVFGNNRWTGRKMDTELGFDPYAFSKRELTTPLGMAGMTLLIKGFRLYLEEAVRRMFPRKVSEDEWSSRRSEATYGKQHRSSAAFIEAVDVLMNVFDRVRTLSPNLDEYRQVTTNAVEDGKLEAEKKRASRVRVHNDGAKPTATGGRKTAKKDTTKAIEEVGKRKATVAPKKKKVLVTNSEGWSTYKVDGEDGSSDQVTDQVTDDVDNEDQVTDKVTDDVDDNGGSYRQALTANA